MPNDITKCTSEIGACAIKTPLETVNGKFACEFFGASNTSLFEYTTNAFEFGARFMNAYYRAYGEMPLAESYSKPHETAHKVWARAAVYFLEDLGLIERKERDPSEIFEITGRLAMAPDGSLSFRNRKVLP